jgi:hypothetical protein
MIVNRAIDVDGRVAEEVARTSRTQRPDGADGGANKRLSALRCFAVKGTERGRSRSPGIHMICG